MSTLEGLGFPEGFRLSITDVHPSSTLEGLVSPRALDCQLLMSIRLQTYTRRILVPLCLLVRKDMDVNEHARLLSIALGHTFK
jgi:hypothetical protein